MDPTIREIILAAAIAALVVPWAWLGFTFGRLLAWRGRVRVSYRGPDGQPVTVRVNPRDLHSVRRVLEHHRRSREQSEATHRATPPPVDAA